MKDSKYHKELRAIAACTDIMTEAKKGIGQNYKKGATEDFFFLTVFSLQRSWQKL